MSALTTVTLTISFAIIKHMLADWAGEGVKSQIGQDLLDLCRDRINDWAGNKSERKQIEQVAERIVASMTPLWETESRDLTPNAKDAILLAVTGSIAHAKTDPETLINHQLNEVRLAKSLAEEQQTQRVGFTAAEDGLYLRLLTEIYRQLIYVAHHLNGYVPLVDRFMLLNLEQLLEHTTSLLAVPAEQIKEYEGYYRSHLPHQLNRFEQIGIRYAQDALNRQSLQLAYINLRLEQGTDRASAEGNDPLLAKHSLDVATRRKASRVPSIGPIQEMLAVTSRLVIRGQPGSGKSTLLRWLAMSIAARQLSSGYPALRSWEDVIPFYLRLRSFNVSFVQSEQKRVKIDQK